MICTFTGHRKINEEIKPLLKRILIDLIETRQVNLFYVGNHGAFDRLVRNTLIELKKIYSHIDYAVILAYPPGKRNEFDMKEYTDTLYPEGMEDVPLRFAIIKRNQWMIKQSDYVVAYVIHSFGGASKSIEYAEKLDKKIINLAEEI